MLVAALWIWARVKEGVSMQTVREIPHTVSAVHVVEVLSALTRSASP